MTIPQSVAEILKEHVTLEVEGIDRMYLNVYVPRLQIVEGVLGFIRRHRGPKVASTRMVEPITRQFVAAIEKFVHDHALPLVCFDSLAAECLFALAALLEELPTPRPATPGPSPQKRIDK
jgi:hypothetical protein